MLCVILEIAFVSKVSFQQTDLHQENILSFVRLIALKQLMNCPTRTTCNTSTFIGHILRNAQEYISQLGIIAIAISDHSMIYCTRKISKAKYNNSFRSLKNYSVDFYKVTLEKVLLPNDDCFDNLPTVIFCGNLRVKSMP